MNSGSVSADSMTHKPYAPTSVPNGMFMRFKAESTMVTMRAQGRNWRRPTPAMIPGADMTSKNRNSPTPNAPKIGTDAGVRILLRRDSDDPRRPAENHQAHQSGNDPECSQNDVKNPENFHVLLHSTSSPRARKLAHGYNAFLGRDQGGAVTGSSPLGASASWL